MRTLAVLVAFLLPAVTLAGVPTPAILVDSNPAVLAPAAFAATVVDDLPDPMRSICRLAGNGAACQFRFRPDAGLDRLTAFITMRDAFDSPVSGCSGSATIGSVVPKGGDACWNGEPGAALMSCDGLVRSGTSDADGALTFVWSRLGGRGIASLAVSVHCAGSWQICRPEFLYTSSDLDADGQTSVSDLALWAACLLPGSECKSADYTCDCSVGVADLALLAGGLGLPDCD